MDDEFKFKPELLGLFFSQRYLFEKHIKGYKEENYGWYQEGDKKGLRGRITADGVELEFDTLAFEKDPRNMDHNFIMFGGVAHSFNDYCDQGEIEQLFLDMSEWI